MKHSMILRHWWSRCKRGISRLLSLLQGRDLLEHGNYAFQSFRGKPAGLNPCRTEGSVVAALPLVRLDGSYAHIDLIASTSYAMVGAHAVVLPDNKARNSDSIFSREVLDAASHDPPLGQPISPLRLRATFTKPALFYLVDKGSLLEQNGCSYLIDLCVPADFDPDDEGKNVLLAKAYRLAFWAAVDAFARGPVQGLQATLAIPLLGTAIFASQDCPAQRIRLASLKIGVAQLGRCLLTRAGCRIHRVIFHLLEDETQGVTAGDKNELAAALIDHAITPS